MEKNILSLEELNNKILNYEKEIADFKNRSEVMSNQINAQEDAIRNLITQIQELIKYIGLCISCQDTNAREHAFVLSNATNAMFEIKDSNVVHSDFFYPKIMNPELAVQEIIDKRKSVARFGDGEFSIMFGQQMHPFQTMDEELANRLKQVIQSNYLNLMIGIADNYGNLEKYTDLSANGIRLYMQPNERRRHMSVLSKDRIYCDAYITRPYIIYRDKFTNAPKKRFEHLKKIWDNRNVVMIEGAKTRLGVGNDLFENCASVQRILAPATNSYSRYPDILEAALNYAKPDILFLIATGPSAGVFAYDLTIAEYQAVDIGHIDIEYEWFLKGTGEREPIPNKYTNEIPDAEDAIEETDPDYLAQILCRFE